MLGLGSSQGNQSPDRTVATRLMQQPALPGSSGTYPLQLLPHLTLEMVLASRDSQRLLS